MAELPNARKGMRSDDELSELAEALADACERSPVRVSASDKECACPFGALLGPPSRRPSGIQVLDMIPALGGAHLVPFMAAFDGISNPTGDSRMFDLGLQFRELYP